MHINLTGRLKTNPKVFAFTWLWRFPGDIPLKPNQFIGGLQNKTLAVCRLA